MWVIVTLCGATVRATRGVEGLTLRLEPRRSISLVVLDASTRQPVEEASAMPFLAAGNEFYEGGSAIVGERDGIDLEGLGFRVEKHMQSDPRRIAALPIRLTMPRGLDGAQRAKLERAALTCPVHRSLLPEIDIPTHFEYPD